ncbi:hypothetical protein ACOMHN_011050 [Nucella lapillus]
MADRTETGFAESRGTSRPYSNPQLSQNGIKKNVVVVSVGFLFVFTSFQAISNLQTSLNKEDGVGAYSLSAIYAALILSCVFLPKFVIARLGCKWTIPLCMIAYALYMAANFYAVIWLLTIAGVLVGISAAPMWSAKCTYLTRLGLWYARMTNQSNDAVINKFFGFFFMVFQTSQIWGNLISSTILRQPDSNGTDIDQCGPNFDPRRPTNITGFTQPWELVRNLCIVYILCCVLGIMIIILLLDPIQSADTDKQDNKLSPKLLVSTIKHLISSRTQMLLIPLTTYSGMEQAFIGGDFSQAYVSCTIGVSNVGYIYIVYGVVDAACSFLFGRLVQYVGHIPFFVLAMYGALFTDNTEAAFANYRLWESAGFVMTYAYNNTMVTSHKLYVCLAFLITGMVGYTLVEFIERDKLSRTADKAKD